MATQTRAIWKLDEIIGTLTVTLASGIIGTFDLTKLYIHIVWNTLDKVEKALLAYATQQKLADTTARGKEVSLTDKEKLKVMVERFDLMVNDRLFNKASEGRKSNKDKLREGYINGTISKTALKGMVDVGIINQTAHDEIIKSKPNNN